ncbi:MAG: hypothetical protein WBB32_11605 [Flavobacteriales bacterium]
MRAAFIRVDPREFVVQARPKGVKALPNEAQVTLYPAPNRRISSDCPAGRKAGGVVMDLSDEGGES